MRTRIIVEIDGDEDEVKRAIAKLHSWGNRQDASIVIDEPGVEQ